MNQLVMSRPMPSYLDQSPAVRARFERLKARDVILRVKHLSKVFTSRAGSTLALNDINFSTHRREFLCVVGPKEAETGNVGVRSRDKGELGAMTVGAFEAMVLGEIATRGC